MPPLTASAKNSPKAALAVSPDIDVKEVDDVNTHTSESVCSSSGTEAETTTSSIHVTSLHHCLTERLKLSAANGLAAVGMRDESGEAASGECSCSPISPTPCGPPEDILHYSAVARVASQARGAAVSTPERASPAESPTRLLHSTPTTTATPVYCGGGEKRRTPAPPPPIDFCGSLHQSSRQTSNNSTLPLPTPLRENDRRDSLRLCAASENGFLSSPSIHPGTSSLSVSPASTAVESGGSGGGGSEPKNGGTTSVLHAYSEPFHPQERAGGVSCSSSTTTASTCGGLGALPGSRFAAERISTVWPALSPPSSFSPHYHYDYASSAAAYGALDCHPAPSAVMSASAGNGLGNDVHWQDSGASAYAYAAPFTHLGPATESGGGLKEGVPPIESGGGGGGGCGHATRVRGGVEKSSGAAAAHDGTTGTSVLSTLPLDGPGGVGRGSAWNSSAASPARTMSVDFALPMYADPHQQPFSRAAPLQDYDYQDGANGYDGGGFAGQEMRFGAYVPQELQCVEHLEELDYVCRAILDEATMRQCHYQRRLRERQYLAEDACEEDALDSKMVIALDLEGRSLGRAGSICIITLATTSTVYIIDVVLLGAEALGEGSSLKAVLEAETITKLMFDCRADCDALFFLYHVRLRGVCDLQVSSCFALFPMARRLPGMKDVFRALGLFADEDTEIKDAGRHLFNPESGGSFDRWEERPLTALLLQYCAVDVKYFFMAKLMLWDHIDVGYSFGEARLASVCAGNFVGCSKGNSLRDFDMK